MNRQAAVSQERGDTDFPMVEVDYEYTVGGAGNRSGCVELIKGNWQNGVPKKRFMQKAMFE